MFAGLSTFMPHSPRQLIRTGKIELAKKEFRRIHRDQSKGETEFGHREHEDGEGEREFELMRGQVESEMEKEIKSYSEIWRVFRHRVLV